MLSGSKQYQEDCFYSNKNIIQSDGSYLNINTNENSKAKIHYNDGTVYSGQLNLGKKPHGQGIMTNADSSFWRGEFVDNKRKGIGYGKRILADGAIYEG